MKKNIIIATIKSWNKANALKFKAAYGKYYGVYIITNKQKLTNEYILKTNPRYIFFPHWCWIIPGQIYKNFECVVFHMTDLPFGRGGSPLQNLLLRGISKTKISALRVCEEIDSGPIYFKRDLTLNGSAEEIYKRASDIVFGYLIPRIIKYQLNPVPQKGRVTLFKGRTPQESKIPDDMCLEKAYDFIRMLDAEGYPRAFIEKKRLLFQFSAVKKDKLHITCTAVISKRELL